MNDLHDLYTITCEELDRVDDEVLKMAFTIQEALKPCTHEDKRSDIDILIAALEISKKQGAKEVLVIDENYIEYNLRVAFHNARAHFVVSPSVKPKPPTAMIKILLSMRESKVTMKAQTLINRILKTCKENGVDPRHVDINYRRTYDSDVYPVKVVEEDLFDAETNKQLTSIVLVTTTN